MYILVGMIRQVPGRNPEPTDMNYTAYRGAGRVS